MSSRDAVWATLTRLLVVTAIFAAVAACTDEGIVRGIIVKNDTSQTLHFAVDANGTRRTFAGFIRGGDSTVAVLLSDITPDIPNQSKDGCLTVDLIALAPDGTEVARHPPPLCSGQMWIIAQTVGSPSPAPLS